MSTSEIDDARPDIFLSYKREERAEARAMAQALEQVGWDVWWDPELRTGEHFDDVIGDALARSRCIVVLWSRRAIASRYIRDEATFGLKEQKLVPVRLDDSEPPFRFQGLHTLDFSQWAGDLDAPEFVLLQRDLSDRIGTPGGADGRPEPAPGVVVQPPPGPRPRLALLLGASVAVLVLAAGLWRWIDSGPVTDCVMRLTVEGTATRARPLTLDLLGSEGQRRALALQRDPQTEAGVTTTSLDARSLDRWRVNVRWDDGTQSQFPARDGCQSGEEVSDDGLARLRITPL